MGPTAASAILKVNDSYTWDLGVNVVQVDVSNPTTGATFRGAARPQDGGTWKSEWPNPNHPADLKLAASGGDPNVTSGGKREGLISRATVTLAGPTLNGIANRGVAQIQVGFIQNLQALSHRGVYDAGGGRTFVRRSEQEGKTWWWDAINKQKGKWYDSSPAAKFDDAAPNGVRTKTIETVDEPAAGPPVRLRGHDLKSMRLVWNFRLYVAGVTTDKHGGTLGANAAIQNTYVSEAEAKGAALNGADWQFDGTGTIGAALVYPWTQTGKGVTPPTGWGAVVQKMTVAGIAFNIPLKHYARWF